VTIERVNKCAVARARKKKEETDHDVQEEIQKIKDNIKIRT
jgi:hypothetical protein